MGKAARERQAVRLPRHTQSKRPRDYQLQQIQHHQHPAHNRAQYHRNRSSLSSRQRYISSFWRRHPRRIHFTMQLQSAHGLLTVQRLSRCVHYGIVHANWARMGLAGEDQLIQWQSRVPHFLQSYLAQHLCCTQLSAPVYIRSCFVPIHLRH